MGLRASTSMNFWQTTKGDVCHVKPLLLDFKVLKDKHWKNVAQRQACRSAMMTTRKRNISLMFIIKIIKNIDVNSLPVQF